MRPTVHHPAVSSACITPTTVTPTPIVHTPTAPVRAISAGRLNLPGGRATKPQQHLESESIFAIVSGSVAVLYGAGMEPVLPVPSDMVYLAPGMPYAVVNLSDNASALVLVFRTDPGFRTDVHHTPDLTPVAAARADQLRIDHLKRLLGQRAGRARRPQ